MFVKLGPYKNFIGPYQIADWLQHIGVSEERCHKIGNVLAKTWLSDICEWIYNRRKRTVKVKLDPYDTWNLDHTLALIIAPCLRQLKATRHGIPCIEKEDLPEELKDEKDWSSKSWEWAIDEMIFSFESIINMDYLDMTEEEKNRQSNGLILFSKYFISLWD